VARWDVNKLARYDVLKRIRNRILYETYHAAQLFTLRCLCCGKLYATPHADRSRFCGSSCRDKADYRRNRAMKMGKGAKKGGQQKSGSGIPAPTKNNAGSAQGIVRKRG